MGKWTIHSKLLMHLFRFCGKSGIDGSKKRQG
jgi:hypothetical protein